MNTTDTINQSTLRNGMTLQQWKSYRGLETSNRRFRRLGIMPDQIAALHPSTIRNDMPESCYDDMAMSEAQAKSDYANVTPDPDMFTVQRKQGETWVHVTPPAKRARDLEAEAELMAKANPSQQYRIAKPGAKRAVIAYNAR